MDGLQVAIVIVVVYFTANLIFTWCLKEGSPKWLKILFVFFGYPIVQWYSVIAMLLDIAKGIANVFTNIGRGR